ncbi:MAG: outer membrane beta-barrel protein [Methylovirgula sp.]|jgi:outer membrane immunogenic protein
MGKSLLAGSVLAAFLSATALSTSAFAADLPTTKGPAVYTPPPPPTWNWAGLYAGVSGGWGWGHAEHTDASGFDSGVYTLDGGIVGGTLGYNWQMYGLVVGFDGDGSGAWIRGSTPGAFPGCGSLYCASRLDALGTVRGRVGFAYDRFMPYLTGGAAIGDIHGHEGAPGGGAFGDGSSAIVGWTIGVGLEAKIAPQWSAKIEFLHVDLGNHPVFNDIGVPGFAGPVAQNVRFSSEIVRAGLNYQFDLFTPPGVISKY